jgi:hypothetical protein
MSGPQQVAETLTLTGNNIARVVIRAPQNETLLLRYCCEPNKLALVDKPAKEPLKEKPEKREKPEIIEKPTKEPLKEKPEKWEKPEFKEFKEPKEIFENPPGQPGQPSGLQAPSGDVEARLARLEAALPRQAHFVDPSLRPDLSMGALSQEADLQSLDPRLRKGAQETRKDKDSKDSGEKPTDG